MERYLSYRRLVDEPGISLHSRIRLNSVNGSLLKPLDLALRFIVIFLLSIFSFFALDQFPWFIMMEWGLNMGLFVLFVFIRALFAERLMSLMIGVRHRGILEDGWKSIIFAALIFGLPLFTLFFILERPTPILSPFVSLAWFTIRGGLIYEFPRLILFAFVRKNSFSGG